MKKDVAIIFVDVQSGIIDKQIYNERSFLHNIILLIAYGRRKEIPMVFIQHENQNFLLAESDGWKLHPALLTSEQDIFIRKQHPSAFQDTTLDAILNELGIKKLIIAGLVTHGCFQATCNQALDLGYQVTCVTDAHSSYNKEAKRLIFKWNQSLSENGCVLATTSEITNH